MCVVTLLIRLVAVPPRASEWLNVAVKSSNTPSSEDRSRKLASAVCPGAMSPKLTVSDGVTCWLPTWVPMIWKVSSRPFAFWRICGWAVVIERLFAVPPPTLVTSNPRTAGSLG